MALNVKSNARKQNLGLTVVKATRDARRAADATMPAAHVTVDSRRTHDLTTDTPVIVTTITFPSNDTRGYALYQALSDIPGRHGCIKVGSASYIVTRKVK